MSFWYAQWNKRGMTIFCFKYCPLMVWHSKGTCFYARCGKRIHLFGVCIQMGHYFIIYKVYFWELCDLCLRSQSTYCQTPHVITESGSKAMEETIIRHYTVYLKWTLSFFFVFWLIKLYYYVWLSSIPA